jgi:Mg/Co/Ni transporter MgtE
MITDRDIAVRAVAEHLGPDTPVREVMSHDIKYCFEDEDLEHVAANMADLRVRRLPVVDQGKRLVGIVSLGDVAMVQGRQAAGEAVTGVSRRGGPRSQTTQRPQGARA